MVKQTSKIARRKRTKPLSLEGIVLAAMRLADREGLEAISIRRIAHSLGSGAMSLYRHVRGKEEILDLLLDAAYAEITLPETSTGDWQIELASLARQTRNVLKCHWWLGPLLTSRPTFGSHYLRWFEFQLEVTGRAGFTMEQRVRVIGTLFAYVSGVVGYELAEEANNRRHGLTPERKRKAASPILEPLFESGQFPNLRAFVESCAGEATDESFEFGLEAVLRGLAGSPPGLIERPSI